ncbi:hypothetical protein, partial [Corallococcus praedator]|uniref:hypothetical protein n=1 Tax=Corallococcus praedator TaxID=2316724 RepID=UPI001ABEF791
MKFDSPSAHFVPFYMAKGAVTGDYVATVTFSDTHKDSNGNTRTTTRSVHIPRRSLTHSFFHHNTQVYAGYRRDPKHVRILQGEHVPMIARTIDDVDLARADDLNQFEMSLATLNG